MGVDDELCRRVRSRARLEQEPRLMQADVEKVEAVLVERRMQSGHLLAYSLFCWI